MRRTENSRPRIFDEAMAKSFFKGLPHAFFVVVTIDFFLFPKSGRTLGVKREQGSLGDQQVRETEQREELRGVLGEAVITHLLQSENVLDDAKRMLNLGSDARVGLLDLFIDPANLGLRQQLAFAGAQGDVPLHRAGPILFALLDALVTRVAEGQLLLTLQERMRLRHIGDVRRRRDDTMRNARVGINADMSLHAKVPFVTLLRLMHLRVALAVPVLRRGRCGNDRRIDDRTFFQRQTLGREVDIDRREDAFSQLVRFEPPPKLEQRRCIRGRLPAQIETDKAADRLAVVQRVFRSFVGESEALLRDVHAQHALQPNWLTTAPFAFRTERQGLGNQLRPGRHRLDLAEKAIAPRHLLLRRVFQGRKTRLHRCSLFNFQRSDFLTPSPVSTRRGANKSARP